MLYFCLLILSDPFLTEEELIHIQVFQPLFGSWQGPFGYLVSKERVVKLDSSGTVLASFEAFGPGPREIAGAGPIGQVGDRVFFKDIAGKKWMWFSQDLHVLESGSTIPWGRGATTPRVAEGRLWVMHYSFSQKSLLPELQVFDLDSWQKMSTCSVGATPEGTFPPPGELAWSSGHFVFSAPSMIQGWQLKLSEIDKASFSISRTASLTLPILPPHGLDPVLITLPERGKTFQPPSGPQAYLTVSEFASLQEKLVLVLRYQYMPSFTGTAEEQFFLLVLHWGKTLEILDLRKLDGYLLRGCTPLSEPFLFYRPEIGLYRTTLRELLTYPRQSSNEK